MLDNGIDRLEDIMLHIHSLITLCLISVSISFMENYGLWVDIFVVFHNHAHGTLKQSSPKRTYDFFTDNRVMLLFLHAGNISFTIIWFHIKKYGTLHEFVK